MRDVNEHGKGGRIVHISSGTGIRGYPVTGFYSASKHGEQRAAGTCKCLRCLMHLVAMEGLAETLSMKLDPEWNIKVREQMHCIWRE